MEKDFFLNHLAQTNEHPFLLQVERAEGIYIYDKSGAVFMDMIAGVAVNNIGHCHPKVISAIKNQVDKHMHVMVYGEFVQEAQNEFGKTLLELLPEKLNCVYAVNSGTEANEAAIKLAKRKTGRMELIAFTGAYHGSTNGSLSISSNETKKQAYRPLLPEVRFLEWNDATQLVNITNKTAGVIIETIQGDAGVRIPSKEFMSLLKKRCDEVGALLIFDEIQCGMGRTGKIFAFEHFGITPDILTLGKALGGGMPVGALVSSKEIMSVFTNNPMLGHITTFGGNPVICAAARATLEVLKTEINLAEVERLGLIIETKLLSHTSIKAIRRIGLMFAFDMESGEIVTKLVEKCKEKGLITFWFLSNPHSFRLSPPLNITEDQVNEATKLILEALDEISN
ncbi:MAG: aspartate aminotransferase family protein [Flavobacteriia bacterium]|nr:aspartate aminotransferase family protein [Flavobacteriia bacterium]